MKKIGYLILLALTVFVVGCGNNPSDDGLSSQQKQAGSRIDQIAKASGGDWEKVSQEDKDFLVKEVAHGSEQSAKMMLKSKAGLLHGAPGPKGQ